MPVPHWKTVLSGFRKSLDGALVEPVMRWVHTLFARVFLGGRVMHVATASDSSHFHSMLQMINTLKIMEKSRFRVIAYDLGLSDADRAFFGKTHPDVELRRFPFEDYPAHFSMSQGAGEYAWKPCILHDVYSQLDEGEFLIWHDGGNFIKRKMWIVRSALFFRGFYTRLATGTIGEWTHPDTNRILNMDAARGFRMISGGLIAVRKDKRNDRLVKEWRDGAMNKRIIAPEGSSRKNHRQDQSVVSILYYKHYPFKNSPPRLSRLEHEIAIHQDIG